MAKIKGTKGNDVRRGTAENDSINLLDGNDRGFGKEGNDKINGGNGNDDMRGNAGNDKLNGGSGSDSLAGDAGDDFLIGGGGSDVFAFDLNDGFDNNDVIKDFRDGADRISLRGFSGSDQELLFYAQRQGDDTVFTFDDGSTLTLKNFDRDDLDGSDFL